MSKLIRKVLNKLLLAPTEKVEGDVKSYVKAIESGRFKDKIVFGISDEERGFHSLDPVKQPGALYCGGMGSGKSIAMRFSVGTHIAVNSENTFYILVDTLKGMTDYTMLFKDDTDDFGNIIKENPYKKNVVAAVNDTSKIVPVVDMIHAECMSRKEEFSRVGANNIYSYDRIMQEKAEESGENFDGLARMMICIEEFHAIPNSPQVKFAMRVDQQGSIANKLKELMRVGRSYGIFFMFATQRATSEDVPSQLKPGLSMMMAFRMNNPGEASAMNLPHAQEIGVKQRGRCAYEDGFIQYPYIDDKVLDVMLKKYYKPLKAKLLKYKSEDYHEALGGEGNDGMVWIKPFKDIIKFASQYDIKTITRRLLKEFKIEVELQENEAYVADMIGTKYDDRYAIRLINTREQGSKKEIEALQKGAEILGCNKILVIVSDISPPSGVSNLDRAQGDDSIILDNDDLIQIANMLDSRTELEEKGKFHELYLRYGIADAKDLVKGRDDGDNDIESLDIEKKEILSKEESIDLDYGYLLKKGFLEDENFMRDVLINAYKYNITNLKEEELNNLIEKYNLTQDQIIKTIPNEDSQEVIEEKIEVEEIVETIPKVPPVKESPIENRETPEVKKKEDLREKLRLEREAYKARLKEERKKFLDQLDEPIEGISTVKEEKIEHIEEEKTGSKSDTEDQEYASENEIIEIKEEREKKEDTSEQLDKDVLLKIRERLKQNILKEREQGNI